MDTKRIVEIIQTAKRERRVVLLETEGLDILEAMGIETPKRVFVRASQDVSAVELTDFPGDTVVVKVVSPEILHKSDVGGVKFVAKEKAEVLKSILSLEQSFQDKEIRGFTINEFVPYNPSLGGEILIGARWTQDFGPVVTYSAGGIYTEFLVRNFVAGKDIAVFSPELSEHQTIEEQIKQVAITSLISGELRGQKKRVEIATIVNVITKFQELAGVLIPEQISEFEVNPFVIARNTLVPLDALLKCEAHKSLDFPEKPVDKIKSILEPKSIAIIGVSEKANAGRLVLNNLIQSGFHKSSIYIVKPKTESIEGCKCYPDVKSLPEKVDLFIFSLSAAQLPETLEGIIQQQKAESIIVIAGGLEEKAGGEETVSKINSLLYQSRFTDWGGPIINGGNCLGIYSQPGNYNSFFIPHYKLPFVKDKLHPVALISQSGGFACSKASKLGHINPRYVISLGNQMDLTVGDYLTYLESDRSLEAFGIYVEGFKPLDGLKFLKAVKEITAKGKTVIFYQAGRTKEGTKATASHTASVAGDYQIARELAKNSGAIVVESIEDFEELLELFALLHSRQVKGLNLGGVSNAGFINVATADNLKNFQFPSFDKETSYKLQSILKKSKLDGVVDLHNPVDVTGLMNDSAYEETFLTVMKDKNVDAGIISCVPVVAALNTLASQEDSRENIYQEDSFPMRLVKLKQQINKPWVAVIDGGDMYNPAIELLRENGVPTFRVADRAIRLLNLFCNEQLRKKSKF
jgi:acyl-CoA synthetase (NDP forming)